MPRWEVLSSFRGRSPPSFHPSRHDSKRSMGEMKMQTNKIYGQKLPKGMALSQTHSVHSVPFRTPLTVVLGRPLVVKEHQKLDKLESRHRNSRNEGTNVMNLFTSRYHMENHNVKPKKVRVSGAKEHESLEKQLAQLDKKWRLSESTTNYRAPVVNSKTSTNLPVKQGSDSLNFSDAKVFVQNQRKPKEQVEETSQAEPGKFTRKRLCSEERSTKNSSEKGRNIDDFNNIHSLAASEFPLKKITHDKGLPHLQDNEKNVYSKPSSFPSAVLTADGLNKIVDKLRPGELFATKHRFVDTSSEKDSQSKVKQQIPKKCKETISINRTFDVNEMKSVKTTLFKILQESSTKSKCEETGKIPRIYTPPRTPVAKKRLGRIEFRNISKDRDQLASLKNGDILGKEKAEGVNDSLVGRKTFKQGKSIKEADSRCSKNTKSEGSEMKFVGDSTSRIPKEANDMVRPKKASRIRDIFVSPYRITTATEHIVKGKNSIGKDVIALRGEDLEVDSSHNRNKVRNRMANKADQGENKGSSVCTEKGLISQEGNTIQVRGMEKGDILINSAAPISVVFVKDNEKQNGSETSKEEVKGMILDQADTKFGSIVDQEVTKDTKLSAEIGGLKEVVHTSPKGTIEIIVDESSTGNLKSDINQKVESGEKDIEKGIVHFEDLMKQNGGNERGNAKDELKSKDYADIWKFPG